MFSRFCGGSVRLRGIISKGFVTPDNNTSYSRYMLHAKGTTFSYSGSMEKAYMGCLMNFCYSSRSRFYKIRLESYSSIKYFGLAIIVF